ncbi:MAG: phosphoribosylaminoimidazolesuccinocarboxamide synthase [Candidatus Lokiarchaeota archaeon]|nr:phosphoribosylaminoimidazolesuccinocarboxamide synthase [Candidatus Lokiarchaeota archaeon]
MVDKAYIQQNLSNTLQETNFPQLGTLYRGKVRDNYTDNEKNMRFIIATDRLSAFDRVITTIPFKGELLNQTSTFWFKKTKNLVPNHLIDIPDPNVAIVHQCDTFPIEMVIRNYVTGSAWRAYQRGERVSGIRFPEGLKKNQKLPEPVITPSTKAEKGLHDEPISKEDILEKRLVTKEVYEILEEYTYKLFEFGQLYSAKNNLILVDCKYEFGTTKDDEIVVIDEIHTQDSSRFWIKDTYQERFAAGEEPDILDKEFFRGWLMEQGYMGDGPMPEIVDEVRIELAERYIQSYEILTNELFTPDKNRKVLERIRKNLKLK